jgi:hypothetical protein
MNGLAPPSEIVKRGTPESGIIKKSATKGFLVTVTQFSRAFLASVLICFVVAPSVHAKSKERTWEDGILLDSSVDRGKRVAPTAYGEMSLRDDVTYYRIDDGRMVYVVSRTLRNRRDKPLDVTINAHVQFSIEGATCYLRDAEGKEHKLSVEKKIAK